MQWTHHQDWREGRWDPAAFLSELPLVSSDFPFGTGAAGGPIITAGLPGIICHLDE